MVLRRSRCCFQHLTQEPVPADMSECKVGTKGLAEPPTCDFGHPITKRKEGLRGWQIEKMLGIVEQKCAICQKDLLATDVRWKCHNNCNYDLCQSCYDAKLAGTEPVGAPAQPVDIRTQDVVMDIAAQRTKAVAVFEVAVPLLRKRKEELETQFKDRAPPPDGPDALAFARLLRLRGIEFCPIDKYEAVLNELNDPLLPEIDAEMVQKGSAHGLDVVREKLRMVDRLADECSKLLQEVGESTEP